MSARIGRVLRLLMMAGAVTGGAAGAQPVVTAAPLSPDCGAGQLPMVIEDDYPVVITAGTAWNRHEYTPQERTRILFHADAMRQHFAAPATLGTLPVLAEAPIPSWGGLRSPHSAVGGKIVLVMRADGHLRTTFWSVLPFSKTFAVAVTNAAIAADKAGDFLGIPRPDGMRGDDTLVVQVLTAIEAPTPEQLPLMRARLSTYVMEEQARVVKPGGMYYPDGAAYSGIENKGEMLVLVGSDGKPIMSATQVTRIEWRDFLSTMTRAIEGTQYSPARSGGCAVPSLAIHTFNFAMDRNRR